MPYISIEKFTGLDSRRSELTSNPGALLELTNAHVNQGGEIEKRKKFGYLRRPGKTFGLVSTDSGLMVFGSKPLAVATTFRARAANVATVTINATGGVATGTNAGAGTNNVVVGDHITITGLGGVGYNVADVVVTAVSGASGNVISYANTGSNEGSTADTAGTVTKLITTGLVYQKLPHPWVEESKVFYNSAKHDISQVLFGFPYKGKAFVYVKYNGNEIYAFYDGAIVDHSRNGVMPYTGASTIGDTDLRRELLSFPGWDRVNEIATDYTGGSVYGGKIRCPQGLAFSGVTSETAASGSFDIAPLNYSLDPVQGVAAVARFTIATDASNPSVVQVFTGPANSDGSGTVVLVPPEVCMFDAAEAAAVAAQRLTDLINFFTPFSGYSAMISGTAVVVYAPVEWGDGANGANITITLTAVGGGATTASTSASTVTPPFSIGLSTNVIDTIITGLPSKSTVISDPVSVVVTPATIQPTFDWKDLTPGGSGIAITAPQGKATTFSASLNKDEVLRGTFSCKVTSQGSSLTTDIVTVTLTYKRKQLTVNRPH